MKRRSSKSGVQTILLRSIMDSIRHIVQALRLFDRAAEKHSGLSGAQLFVLSRLAGEQGLSVNQLAERSHTHQSSVSVVVQRLLERGLVRRSKLGADARVRIVTLTAAGKALLSEAPDAAQERFLAALREFPPSDLAKLAGLLSQLTAAAGVAQPAAPMFFEDSDGHFPGQPAGKDRGSGIRRHKKRPH